LTAKTPRTPRKQNLKTSGLGALCALAVRFSSVPCWSLYCGELYLGAQRNRSQHLLQHGLSMAAPISTAILGCGPIRARRGESSRARPPATHPAERRARRPDHSRRSPQRARTGRVQESCKSRPPFDYDRRGERQEKLNFSVNLGVLGVLAVSPHKNARGASLALQRSRTPILELIADCGPLTTPGSPTPSGIPLRGIPGVVTKCVRRGIALAFAPKGRNASQFRPPAALTRVGRNRATPLRAFPGTCGRVSF
jgi:hypothetical protein